MLDITNIRNLLAHRGLYKELLYSYPYELVWDIKRKKNAVRKIRLSITILICPYRPGHLFKVTLAIDVHDVHAGILILSVIFLIIVSILRLSTGQQEPIFRLSDAYFGCPRQTNKPYATSCLWAIYIYLGMHCLLKKI